MWFLVANEIKITNEDWVHVQRNLAGKPSRRFAGPGTLAHRVFRWPVATGPSDDDLCAVGQSVNLFLGQVGWNVRWLGHGNKKLSCFALHR